MFILEWGRDRCPLPLPSGHNTNSWQGSPAFLSTLQQTEDRDGCVKQRIRKASIGSLRKTEKRQAMQPDPDRLTVFLSVRLQTFKAQARGLSQSVSVPTHTCLLPCHHHVANYALKGPSLRLGRQPRSVGRSSKRTYT